MGEGKGAERREEKISEKGRWAMRHYDRWREDERPGERGGEDEGMRRRRRRWR